MDTLRDGFALEAVVESFIVKGMFEMIRAPRAMDLHAGTDFVLRMDTFNVAVGVTLRDDRTKHEGDGCKFGRYVRDREMFKKFAPIHIEIVIDETDALDWDAAVVRALVKADEIACDWESQDKCVSFFNWQGFYRQVVIKATKRGVNCVWRDIVI